jgi:hypothetical protein
MILITLVLLAAELPDVGSPTFPSVGAGFGGFVGALIGYVRRNPEERIGQLVTRGAFVGFGIGLACWLAAFAIDRL